MHSMPNKHQQYVSSQAEAMVEALRPLVGDNAWDYCMLWKLSQDKRYLEWMGCCCYGTVARIENGAGLFSGGGASAMKTPCRDAVFQHPRTRACDALSELPSSIPLDSSLGVYAQVLMSNQPTWQYSNYLGSTSSDDTVGAKTRLLVPIPGGLVELFVSKQVPEDQQIVDFIMSQCNTTATGDFLEDSCNQNASVNDWMDHHQGFQWDPSVADQAQMYIASPLNLFDSAIDNAGLYQHQQSDIGEPIVVVGGAQGEKESVKQEGAAGGRGESGTEGSEDDEEPRAVGRNGKRGHSKNLVAERKRRKKLNDRLYALRALVPKITKMDRASILGDAIEYVMELQKLVKDLQDELENDNSPEEAEEKQIETNYEMETSNNTNGIMSNIRGMELDESPNGAHNSTKISESMKQSHEQPNNIPEEKVNQMEPQVEVKQLEANEFYLKIFCEHKVGGFARLMEAMSSLGLEVTNASVTTLQTLVLNVFRVQKRDNEMMQVDQVRDSLLELTRGPIGAWPERGHAAAITGDYQHHLSHHHHHHHHQQQLHYLHHQT